MTHYDREALVDVIVRHERRNSSRCYCGWSGGLGTSYAEHAEHVTDVYEAAVRHPAESAGATRETATE